MAGNIDLAKMIVKLEAQTAQFTSEMAAMKRKLADFQSFTKTTLRGLAGAFGAVQIAQFAKGIIDAADHINDMSQRTGVAVEDLSRLEFAAKQSGVDIEAVGKAFGGLAKSIVAAHVGNEGAVRNFERLGVAFDDASGRARPMMDVMLDIAEQFSQIENGAAKAAVAQNMFGKLVGKTGLEMIPLLNKGREGIEALARQSDILGNTLSTSAAQAADEFNDHLEVLKGTSTGFARDLIIIILPALTKFVQGLATASAATKMLFMNLGRGLGALAAAGVAKLKGDTEAAKVIMDEYRRDVEAEWIAFGDRMGAIWNKLPEGMKDAAGALREIEFDKELKKLKDPAAEAAQRLADMAAEMRQAADTFGMTAEQTIRYRVYVGDLADEWAKAGVSADEYIKQIIEMTDRLAELERQQEMVDEMIESGSEIADKSLDAWADKIQQGLDKQAKGAENVLRTLSENTQDILADALTNGFDEGVDGMLKSFGQMLKQMAAQALAADLMKRIFGAAAGGTGSGWLGGLGGFAETLLGGGLHVGAIMDSGGRGQPGKSYMIGTGAQPEMFVPDRPGTFIPAGEMGRGTVVNNFTIEAPAGTVTRATQMQIAAAAARGMGVGSRRNG